MTISNEALGMAARVEAFVRGTIFAYEQDPRRDHHGAPTDELVMEMRELARAAGVLTPHIRPDGSHAEITIDNLRIPADQMLGDAGEGFKYAQIRLAPARLSHCMRWLGGCIRAQEIAVDYANRRTAFGKTLIDHEGVGFMLAENMVDLQQCELMIDWCAGVLDTGSLGTAESSMTKVAVSEALMRVADKCVQVMGGRASPTRPSSRRCSAKSAPSASMTGRPRCTSGALPRSSGATGRPRNRRTAAVALSRPLDNTGAA